MQIPNYILLACVFGFLVLLALATKKLGLFHEEKPALVSAPLPYVKRQSPLTKNEADFYFALAEACRGLPLVVLAQMPMSSLVTVARGTPDRQAWGNRINRKSVDFVLCDEATTEWVLVIEVDDATHKRSSRIERDRFVNAVFETTGAAFLRIPAKPTYSPKEIHQHITKALA